MVNKICPVCGKPFEPKRRNQKYCSLKCRRKSGITSIVMDKIKAHGKGSSYRRNLLVYYDNKCCVCGWSLPGQGLQSGCEFHHITRVADGGKDDMSNLVLLCPNCHKAAHYGVLTQATLQSYTLTQSKIKEHKSNLDRLAKAVESLDNVF